MRRNEALLQLQGCDDTIARLESEAAALRDELGSDPTQIKLATAEQQRRDGVAAVGAAATVAERANAAAVRAAAVVRRQLFGGTVGNPAELLTLEAELAVLDSRVTASSDELLTALEDVEAAEADLAVVAKQLSDHGTERTAARPALELHLADLERQLEAERGDRSATAAEIAPPDLELYRRIGSRLRPAVVRLAGSSCGGCRLLVPYHQLQDVRSGGATLLQCTNCERILAG